MAERLAQLGYDDYRRSDPAVFRRLLRGPTAVGQVGTVLGVSRQAARKIVEGLEQRQFATTERDARDGRQINVLLTSTGEAYARAVVDVLGALNVELSQRVDPDVLAAAKHVLRAVIDG
jgi:DNA-binding MarR family transcriptional regulator